MKTHTTNYENTFIVIAPDCPAISGEVPPAKGDAKTIANLQYDILRRNPYKYTSDDVLFMAFAAKNDLSEDELKQARAAYFSKGQPCFRASPLTKRYGWGIHNNAEGKIAMYGSETEAYENFMNDKDVKVVAAMKSAR